MKTKKKIILVTIFALIAVTVYVSAAYVLTLPHSTFAGFAILGTFIADIAAFALTDALDDRKKPN